MTEPLTTEPITIDGATLDPELQFLLFILDQLGLQPVTEQTLAEFRRLSRQQAAAAAGEPEPVASATDLTVHGAAGALAARLYQPYRPSAALLVYFHGGGFVYGDLETHDGACRLLCATGGVPVLSVEYRLAPEHPFPAAIDDAWAALQWVRAHGATLVADAGRRSCDAVAGADRLALAVGGDSAGASLSAVLAQRCAAEGLPLALQVLLYPAIDPLHAYPSAALFGSGFFLTREKIDFFQRCYTGGQADDPSDPRRHPLVGSLSGLAPALIATAGFDPLRDEGEAYAQALAAAGTPVLLRRFPSLIHGFVNMIGLSSAARSALAEVAERAGAMLRGEATAWS